MALEKLLERWQRNDKYDGSERREFPRLVWPFSKRPTLKVKEYKLKIIDISEGGLKYSDYLERRFGKKVYGTLELLSGESMDVAGEIAWQAENEVGLLTSRIPRSIIIEEIRTLLRGRDSRDGVQEADRHKTMICPNCNFEQNHSAECIRCGIIISKYRDKKPQQSPRREEILHGKESEIESAKLARIGNFPKKTIPGHTWILQKIIPNKLEYLFRDIFTRKNLYYNYVANFLDIMIQAILLVLITIILCIVFLYVCKMSWHVYISTPLGKKFLELYAVSAQSIVYVLNRELILFSIQLTLEAFTICLAISAICQVSHITRYFYLPRGFIGKIVLWGLPLTAIVAIHIQLVFGVKQFGLTYVVALVPTLCVFSGCFKFTYELLPEIGTLIEKSLQIITKTIQAKFPK